jgi:DUF1680 family protein
MNKPGFAALIFFALLLNIVPDTLMAQQDKLRIADNENLSGFLGDRLMNSYNNRILEQNVYMLVEPFKHREETTQWQSEFWGKWFTSAVLAYRYHPTAELKAKLKEAVTGLLATQTSDGYIGNYAEKARLKEWDIWGRKYCLLGLLDYFELTKDTKSLTAAKKLTDHLLSELEKTDGILVTKGNYRGMAASSILEPICKLYKATKDQKYLDFAEKIVTQWESNNGPQLISKANVDVAKRFAKPANWYSFEQGQKAYEMMSCYEGLLELYRITGKSEYKKAVVSTWQNIYDTEINLAGSGAASEMWFGGKNLQTNLIHHYQETCVTVTWIKLCHQLFRLTGEVKYADAAEQSFYNALLGSMSADGHDWAKYTPLSGLRLPGSGQCGMDLNCCVASGPRALFNFPAYMVMKANKGLFINYYAGGTFKTTTPAGNLVQVNQETSYPKNGLIKISLNLAKPEMFSLNLRVPSWSLKNRLLLNGSPIENVGPGYQEITRKWKDGDVVQLELDMRGRVIYQGEKPVFAAIMRGPVLMARDASLKGIDMAAVVNPGGNNGYVDLDEVPSTNVWMQFRLKFNPESYKEAGDNPSYVDLCDYASAGNITASAFRTWFPQLVDPKNF